MDRIRRTHLVPVDDDPDTGGFFEAARREELVIRVCAGCGAVLHLPRAYCHTCGSWDGRWRPVAGFGTLYSWTVVEHQVHPLYPVPYTVVLVELEDVPSVRFVGHLPGAPDLVPGQRMRVWFDDTTGAVVPQWRPVGDITQPGEEADGVGAVPPGELSSWSRRCGNGWSGCRPASLRP